MDIQRLEEFKDLWTSERHKYLLIEYIEPRTKSTEYMIYDVTTNGAVLIEDDEIYPEIIKNMKQAGVQVVDELPRY